MNQQRDNQPQDRTARNDGQYVSDDAKPRISQSPAARSVGPGSQAGGMQTAIHQFAETFTDRIGPLLEPIGQTEAALQAASEGCKPRAILPELREVGHHLSRLIDKVADQQAYVLIFGPLKSGKSTFMNALCGSYVSEVTALPAYPCLVHVAGAQSEQMSLTRYDGACETLSSREALAKQIANAHRSLTLRIRQVEADGEPFDPAEHMPSAIRRIDVRLPLEELTRSGAVLVDTPGLYTRMKFGYDRMTREFRNSAACAIFIVKTDTLFLEQVFEEFGQLLELFSRVFLVVNLDQTKQDLQPDGSLAPSLERRDPDRIIEAFRTLTMSGPLRQAADDGRLKMYGVDILSAAAERIRDNAEPTEARGRFEELMGDLTDYLNSSEYLREFLADSLRRTRSLLGDLGGLLDHEAVRDLYEQRRMLREERTRTKKKHEALLRLGKIAWGRQQQILRKRLAESLNARGEQLRRQTRQQLDEAIDAWFETDQSLAELNNDRVRPLLHEARKAMVDLAGNQLAAQLRRPRAGLDIDDDVAGDLEAGQIDLADLGRATLEQSQPQTALADETFGIQAEQIPVRRRLRDYMLLRSRRAVRRRLLGKDDQPDQPVGAAAKHKQLGQPAREAMRDACARQLQRLLDEATEALADRLAKRTIQAMQKRFAQRLDQANQQTRRQLEQTDALLTEAQRITKQTDALRQAVNDASLAAEQMQDEFVTSAQQTDAAQTPNA